jgi:hypothetical protein
MNEDLRYRIGGDTSGFDAAMRSIDRRAAQTSRTLGTTFGAAGRGIGNIGAALFTRFVGPGGALALLGAASVAVNKTIAEINDLAAASQTAGVGFEEFQELKFAAEQNLIGVDALTDGLKEMQLRIDEVLKTGGGAAKDALGALGFTAEELAAKLKKPDLLFEEIIERLKQFDKASQIRIADEIFGGSGGEQFLRFLDEGDAKVSDLRDSFRDLGGVIDDEMRQSIQDATEGWNAMAVVIDTKVKRFSVDVLNVLFDIVDTFREIENWSPANLKSGLPDNGERKLALEREILDLKRQQAEVTGIYAEAEKRDFERTIKYKQEQFDALTAADKVIIDTLEQRDRVRTPPTDRIKYEPTDLGTPSAGGGGKKSSRDRPDEYERDVQRVIEHTAALVAETEAQRQLNPLIDDYGFAAEKARMERELLTAAEEAGKAVTPQLRAEIAALAEQYALAGAEAERLAEDQDMVRQRSEEMNALGADILSGFRADLRAGASEAEMLSNAIGKIGDKLWELGIDALFGGGGKSGGGIIGQIFGSLFGGGFKANTSLAGFLGVPGYAKGTRNHPGGLAIVGEEGPELLDLPSGSQVFPDVGDIGALAGGQNITFAPTLSISAPNAQAGVGAEIEAAGNRLIEQMKRDFTSLTAKSLREMKVRGIKV